MLARLRLYFTPQKSFFIGANEIVCDSCKAACAKTYDSRNITEFITPLWDAIRTEVDVFLIEFGKVYVTTGVTDQSDRIPCVQEADTTD